jgi:hypothetical protein
MAQDLTIRKQDLQAICFSPECVAWHRISLGTINHPGLSTRKYLSGNLTLSTEEKQKISNKIMEVRSISESDDSQENRKSRLALIASMLMAYPMVGASEESGKARANAYLSAVDDIPPWAVSEAIRLWHRGQGGGKNANYRFAPAPAELRFSAMQVLQPAKQLIAHLTAILAAIPFERAIDPRPIETLGERPWKPKLKLI